ncbi:S-adenosyl-L-methionine-dependent methyltransferase [Bombardia bombarda]|uniref:tRNA wybutosine-synthesizing protein 2 n=1 Tax=Bombardia bombarda TaxID=252184 RepID=A0AA40CDI3_9PEZI|nr:S-adenosyl-L-methionine-dependent methyltransferase [Bombardia bombarda]
MTPPTTQPAPSPPPPSTEAKGHNKRDNKHREKKKKQQNPISRAVSSWLQTLPTSLLLTTTTTITNNDDNNLNHNDNNDNNDALANHKHHLETTAPKRWVIYEPMVLLPSGSFTAPAWRALLASLNTPSPKNQTTTPSTKDALWTAILRELSRSSKTPLTHLAANEGIPLHVGDGDGDGASPAAAEEQGGKENLLRSPSGLKMLYGDFGGQADDCGFDSACWVSTRQNGIAQIWAPRWTMFSRGNVKEKARLLGFHGDGDGDGGGAPHLADSQTPQSPTITPQKHHHHHHHHVPTKNKTAVDLYAGIGYFVFSYAKLGMRVLCWELNPWSVEGLRRGAIANRWTVKVVQGGDLLLPMADLLSGGEQIVVFLEDNARAGARIADLNDKGASLDVLHVNCGFLPTSDKSWRTAWEIQQGSLGSGGWLHLHENVGVADIPRRRAEIQGLFGGWCAESPGEEGKGKAVVEHVEMVKTFAPDVWHVVFDVCLSRRRG